MNPIHSMQVSAPMMQMPSSDAERALAAVRSAGQRDAASDAELESASREFESLLLNMMIREMRATVPESALFPETMAEEIFSSMLDEKIAGEMAENGGIGISRMVFNQLGGAE
jgi:flagellar protein FlgJ